MIHSGYTGKGGEFAVSSELLFRGFNATIMAVDTGMDIVATKGNEVFQIQVKTSNLGKADTFIFDIRKQSFERFDSGNIYYIFVLRDNDRADFLILPYHEIKRKIDEGAAIRPLDDKRYRVNIKLRDDNAYLGTLEHPMTYYLNNWQAIS